MSLLGDKSTGDCGSVGEWLHESSGAGESVGNVVRKWTADVRNLTEAVSRHLGQEGGGSGEQENGKRGERDRENCIGYLRSRSEQKDERLGKKLLMGTVGLVVAAKHRLVY